jgi:hypothetical protein
LGISPARSAVDTDFASAHSFFAGNHFSHAVPRLQEVLRLYPGHALAARELQTALQKKGTSADVSEAEGTHGAGHTATPGRTAADGGGANLLLLYVGLGLLAVALLLAFVFGRRVSAGRQRLLGLRLPGLRLPGLRLPRRGRLGRPGLAHLRDGGELTEPLTGPTPSRDGGAGPPGKPAAAGPARAPSRGLSDRADLTVQRPRVGPPDGGVPVPEQGPREGARASTPPRPAPAPTTRPTTGPTPAPGVATTAMRAQFCTQCGMKMAPEHRFCGFCGHDAGR